MGWVGSAAQLVILATGHFWLLRIGWVVFGSPRSVSAFSGDRDLHVLRRLRFPPQCREIAVLPQALHAEQHNAGGDRKRGLLSVLKRGSIKKARVRFLITSFGRAGVECFTQDFLFYPLFRRQIGGGRGGNPAFEKEKTAKGRWDSVLREKRGLLVNFSTGVRGLLN